MKDIALLSVAVQYFCTTPLPIMCLYQSISLTTRVSMSHLPVIDDLTDRGLGQWSHVTNHWCLLCRATAQTYVVNVVTIRGVSVCNLQHSCHVMCSNS